MDRAFAVLVIVDPNVINATCNNQPNQISQFSQIHPIHNTKPTNHFQPIHRQTRHINNIKITQHFKQILQLIHHISHTKPIRHSKLIRQYRQIHHINQILINHTNQTHQPIVKITA